ncbi:uracil-DNA glycosylase [Aureimonas sp. N4]|uniref:uracil-DNA glycosylase n=1 Tax=Aureimonas sp. N4 TaxID=1638165 RepID=UPI00078244AA|nr:uracil-DNA glycosylase [Aureimonas sp. N4]
MTGNQKTGLDRLVLHVAASAGMPNLFNPYADTDPAIDVPDAASIRCRNLRRYLHAFAGQDGIDLWLGEAPSRFGARRTGVPFTGEGRLVELSSHLAISPFEIATTADAPAAPPSGTSRQIWGALPERLPLFWNAVMHHPHRAATPLRNRTPSRSEIARSRNTLALLVEAIRPRRILAIGRVAEGASAGFGVPVTYVRHPAQGGAAQFRAGVLAFQRTTS